MTVQAVSMSGNGSGCDGTVRTVILVQPGMAKIFVDLMYFFMFLGKL